MISGLHWPNSVTPREQAVIDDYLRVNWRRLLTTTETDLTTLTLRKEEHGLPITLSVIYNADRIATDIFLMMPRSRGVVLDPEAGKKSPKICYSLITGEGAVVIRCRTYFEKVLYLKLLDKPMASLPHVVGFRIQGRDDGYKAQAFLERYDSDLFDYLKNNPDLNIQQRLNLMLQVCKALLVFQQLDVGRKYRAPYHSDVKTSNFLVRGEEVVIADFDISCSDYPGGTRSYMSPEMMTLWAMFCAFTEGEREVYLQKHDLKRYFETYGQMTDIWSLGLAFAEIIDPRFSFKRFLSGIQGEVNDPKKMKVRKIYNYPQDAQGIIEFQLKIDNVFDQRKALCQDAHVTQVRDLIKNHMVRIDSSERWPVGRVFEEISRIVNARDTRLVEE